jgi:putative toxin-antitoxin system antitoxin component (TIGR02293 family)
MIEAGVFMPEKLRQSDVGHRAAAKSAMKKAVAELKTKPAKKSDDESAVLAQAVKVIGDKTEAMRWMGTPVRALDYATPVSLLSSPKGRESVMTVLGRLEHGVL